MMKRAASLALTLMTLAACAEREVEAEAVTAPPGLSDEAFEAQLVRVLNEHPEIILEAIEEFQRRAEQEQVAGVLPDLTSARYGHAIGASEEDASLILVEFFDYHCGYCKRAMEDVLALVEADPTVRVVFQELPILREESREAAKIALAAGRVSDNAYRSVHQALLTTPGVLDEDAVGKALARAGVDEAAVERVLEEDGGAIDAVIDRSLALAQQLRVQGTPYFIAANPETGRYDVLEGYRPEDFAAFVEGARG